MKLGYSLSSEEHGPKELVAFAQRAEEVGFEYAMISDHFHPWIDAQGSRRSMPRLGPHDVLVEVRAVGVCGSDVHYYEHGRIGRYEVRSTIVLGHEASGVVVGLGAEARRHSMGDRVALEPGIPCGRCSECRAGRYNLCPFVHFSRRPGLTVPLALVQSRELVLTGTFRYANTYPTAIALAVGGRIDLDGLVSARFGLEETERALRVTREDPPTIKAMVLPAVDRVTRAT